MKENSILYPVHDKHSPDHTEEIKDNRLTTRSKSLSNNVDVRDGKVRFQQITQSPAYYSLTASEFHRAFQARMEVDDLFTDLADGKKLLKLLEIISGERLAKPNNGRMRVHKIENVNKSLAFLHTKVIPRARFASFVFLSRSSPSSPRRSFGLSSMYSLGHALENLSRNREIKQQAVAGEREGVRTSLFVER